MTSASLFEQLTSNVSPSMVTIASVILLGLILLSTVVFRLFSSSSTESKSASTSKQVANKEKKSKEANPKKRQQQQQQTETTVPNKKKTDNKAKKNANVTPPPPPPAKASSSSSSGSQSEESEEEKAPLVAPKKQSSTANKGPADKKATASTENNKPVGSTNGVKTSTKQQQAASGRNENVDAIPSGEGKKKQSKANTVPAVNKQTVAGRSDVLNKVNAATSNKKQPVAVSSEVQRTQVDAAGDSDQEDDGQWVTHSSKQVNSRNKNKGKNETSNSNNQEMPSASSSSNRKTAPEKRAAGATSTSNNSSSSFATKTEVDDEFSISSNPSTVTSAQIQEPIEICQLLPTGENRYTANDNWWKQALNKQSTFSVDDIGEWPEREQDEQYTVQKRIIPIKSSKALTEKDINVDGNEEINNYKNGSQDEKLNFDNQTNSSSVVTGETATTSQTKKRSTNVRRLS